MATAIINIEALIVLHLTLTNTEAQVLKGMMQNALMDNESEIEREVRITIFHALHHALQEKP